ncbi:hypothetical protein D3P07_21185 [Paenibacillus sp. 1011MAR3C5]|uniref:hypothetical protein n=1 Tax=Paenibacillus sp. 1011MAR3C5 TaxID=1675787 RepID=UPI000E6B507B|nr:hypothetical protein [Paenibacillus sp. 1011MAR3C5]RJE85089.1 hypothetical protein D3P07_21185 [Paenibacillus sp. 1011MAR3C5]
MVKIKRFSKTTISLMLALALVMVPQLAAAGEATVPQTSPPPVMVQPMAVFEGYTYLKSSSENLSIGSNLIAVVTTVTNAKSTVSEVGGTIQLQEWSGTSWINLVPTAPYSNKNATLATGNMTKSVRSGYYYRAKVTHFVTHNGTTETAVSYSETVLAP